MIRGRKKIVIPVIVVVSAVIFPIFMFFIGKWLLLYLGLILFETPAKPEITEQEFSFTLIYSIDGEIKKIEDTLICEYDGIGINEGIGKYLEWKRTLKSGKEEIILWEGTNEEGVKQSIYYNCPSAGYYMGDPRCKHGNAFMSSDIVLRSEAEIEDEYEDEYEDEEDNEYQDEDDYGDEDEDEVDFFEGFISEKRLFEEYKIKIISWQCDPPIQNSFK